jgi:hypothetical protein
MTEEEEEEDFSKLTFFVKSVIILKILIQKLKSCIMDKLMVVVVIFTGMYVNGLKPILIFTITK